MDKLEREDAKMKFLDEQCSVCGGDLVEKEVEKLLKGGINMASCAVLAEVCLHCGERYYSPETVEQFENIEKKLERNETNEFQNLGKSFMVTS